MTARQQQGHRIRGGPAIRFEQAAGPAGDVAVKCSAGHDTFRLVLRVRLAGAMASRVAICTECGETGEI